MNRRVFLSWLGIGMAPGAPIAHAAAEAGRPGSASFASYVTNVRDVVGTRKLPVDGGTRVHLVRQPARSYDPTSIAVVTEQGLEIGYLPSNQSRMLSPLMEAGFPVSARVAATRSKPRPFVSLDICVVGRNGLERGA